MVKLNGNILDAFWLEHNINHPGRSKSDFEVRWLEGYAFYYIIVDKSTDKSVLRFHASVSDYSLSKEVIYDSVVKSMKRAYRVAADSIDNPPMTGIKPKHVDEWLKDYE